MTRPKLREERLLTLYKCEGILFSTKEFVHNNLNILNKYEQKTIKDYLEFLPDKNDIPQYVQVPMTRSPWHGFKNSEVKEVERSGARSAFWCEKKVKFKGCRPIEDDASFPQESLAFGENNISFSKIPFGVLSAEGVMREILAYCFYKANKFKMHLKPICIYEYIKNNNSLGFCLVLRTQAEERIEVYLDYPDHTISDLITANIIREKLGFNPLLGIEIPLKKVNILWYIERKSLALNKMNFKGGFRGLLNSNIGNDILLSEDGLPNDFFLGDFDTFEVVKIPSKPTRAFLKSFILRCTLEVLKGSIPIIDYVSIEDGNDIIRVAEKVKEIYFDKSSLWKAYKRKFDNEIHRLGWDKKLVAEIFSEIQETSAFTTTMLDCVINEYTLRNSKKIEDSMYCLHN